MNQSDIQQSFLIFIWDNNKNFIELKNYHIPVFEHKYKFLFFILPLNLCITIFIVFHFHIPFNLMITLFSKNQYLYIYIAFDCGAFSPLQQFGNCSFMFLEHFLLYLVIVGNSIPIWFSFFHCSTDKNFPLFVEYGRCFSIPCRADG